MNINRDVDKYNNQRYILKSENRKKKNIAKGKTDPRLEFISEVLS